MKKLLTKTAISAAVQASTCIVRLDKLATDRQKFESGLQARSNDKLYSICAGIYGTYLNVKDDKEVLKETVAAMTSALAGRGLRVQSNSSALGVFVRYVFNSERQVTYVYTNALQYLLSENVAVEDAAQHIKDKGGLHECYKATSPSKSAVAKQKKIYDAMPLVEEQLSVKSRKSIGKVKVAPEFVAKTYKDSLTFLIGRAEANGDIDVLTVVPETSKGMLKWAKARLAEFLADEHAKSIEKQKANRKSCAITNAAAKAKAASKQKVDSGTATVEEAIA